MTELRTRIERLENDTEPRDGRLVIWRADRGEPEPDHEPNDVVIKVVRKERNEPKDAA